LNHSIMISVIRDSNDLSCRDKVNVVLFLQPVQEFAQGVSLGGATLHADAGTTFRNDML
jgi:hypothetical protein